MRREGEGAGRMGADGTGLAEAAGLISRSDGAVDDLAESEPGKAPAPPSSSRPHPLPATCPHPGSPASVLPGASLGLRLGDS